MIWNQLVSELLKYVENDSKLTVSRRQQHHLMRRVTEERKWLHLTVSR